MDSVQDVIRSEVKVHAPGKKGKSTEGSGDNEWKKIKLSHGLSEFRLPNELLTY